MSLQVNNVATNLTLAALLLAGCQTSGVRNDEPSQASQRAEMHSLTLIATELQMHLRSDTPGG